MFAETDVPKTERRGAATACTAVGPGPYGGSQSSLSSRGISMTKLSQLSPPYDVLLREVLLRMQSAQDAWPLTVLNIPSKSSSKSVSSLSSWFDSPSDTSDSCSSPINSYSSSSSLADNLVIDPSIGSSSSLLSLMKLVVGLSSDGPLMTLGLRRPLD
jgi:hypothetical protein